jgi:hypothetical protein
MQAGSAYFAPEQLKPRARIDHRADQFSLAAICYETLTGMCPFCADTPSEVARRLLELVPQPPSQIMSEVPSAVDAVLMRALSKDPMERYSNISQLGQALENAAAAVSIQARARRQTPSPSARENVYRVRPGDMAHARTEPSPSFLGELRAGADTPTPIRSEPEPSRQPPPKSAPTNAAPTNADERARRLATAARQALTEGDLDAAVSSAEELLEHALLYRSDDRVLAVLRTHFTLLDRIFSQRIGPLDRRVVPGPASEGPTRPTLAPAAHALLDAARAGITLHDLVERSRLPRRDAIRLIAGLMRRRVITAE